MRNVWDDQCRGLALLRRVRRSPGPDVCLVRPADPGRVQVLRPVRRAARDLAGRSPASRPGARPGGRTPPVLGPVLRPGRASRPLSEARDPEEVRELLSAYFETASTVIRRYGGVVEKFIGDAVMAVWGTPIATESDAERAVRAALDLVDTVRQLGAERQRRHAGCPGRRRHRRGRRDDRRRQRGHGRRRRGQHRRPGAGCGRLRPGAGGLGDPSARVRRHRLRGRRPAHPEGQDRAGAALARHPGRLRCGRLVAARRRPRGAAHRPGRRDAHDPRAVPRRGRAAHPADGRASPARPASASRGWAGSSASTSTGWSTLVNWHHGRCLSYGEGVAFWALAEMVRQRLGIAEDDPPELAATKLVAGPGAVGPRRGRARLRRDPAGPAARRPVRRRTPARELSREELFAGWRIFFERMADDEPVVLMVEDAQHADRGLLDFLDHLVDWSRDLPVYVLVLARPELDDVRPGFGTGRNRVLLTLDPLDDASMRPAGRRPRPRHARRRPGRDRGPGAGRPAVRRRDGPLAGRPRRRPADRRRLPPGRRRRRAASSRTACTRCWPPASTRLAPDVRRLVADAAVLGTSFTGRRAGRGVRPRGRDVVHATAGRAAAPRGAHGLGRPAVARARQLPVRPGPAAPGRLRHALAPGPQGPPPRGGGVPARRRSPTTARRSSTSSRGTTSTRSRPCPTTADADALREQAVAALVRAAERAARTGAPDRASRSYSQAAELVEESGGDPRRCAHLFEASDHRGVRVRRGERGGRPGRGEHRRATRHCGETAPPLGAGPSSAAASCGWAATPTARETLAEAIAGLREPPDADTVTALEQLAMLETFAGTPEADAATVEAPAPGPGSGARAGRHWPACCHVRGMYLARDARLTEAVFHIREAVRLAEEADRPDSAWALPGQPRQRADGHDPRPRRTRPGGRWTCRAEAGNRRGAWASASPTWRRC